MIPFPALLALVPILTPQEPAPTPWLVSRQELDGSWDADGFRAHDPAGEQRGTPGLDEADVAVTSLATMAFLGDGNTSTNGPYSGTVARAVRWLADQQDPETGWIGLQGHARSLRYHALATVTLCESQHFAPDPTVRATCRRALRVLSSRVLEDGGWSADGMWGTAADGLTTGWASLALRSARDAGMEVDEELLEGAVAWFENHMHEKTGIVSSPADGVPDLKATAMGVVCRLTRQRPEAYPALLAAGDRLSQLQPIWRPDGAGMDPELWYLASLANYQLGGRHWKRWNKSMGVLLLRGQRVSPGAGPVPVDSALLPEGSVAGTACTILSVEIYFRYSRIIGAR